MFFKDSTEKPLEYLSHKAYKKDSYQIITLIGVSCIKKGGDLLSRLMDSTIGATGLNFSVRNGKRWNPGAITT